MTVSKSVSSKAEKQWKKVVRYGEFPFILRGFMLIYWCSDMGLQTVSIRG